MTSTSSGDCFQKTVNAVENLESRLQRIKLETAVIEQHNSRLENQKEENSHRETCQTGKDSEVCNVCLKYHSQAPAEHWFQL